MWAKAHELTKAATDPTDGKLQPRAVPRRRVVVEPTEPVEADAPSMTVAAR